MGLTRGECPLLTQSGHVGSGPIGCLGRALGASIQMFVMKSQVFTDRT
jgi:hypothetical protein